ncbi:uncharacterized protein FTJAE_4886 [Fusarium tjaetaba]|uniref:F-box domain-containing protein n=1 Tax=Fusarium tjaetaba TaxID=1567544 RepID=A0A8H5RUW9_9HYPO|nr:uncharacterized protein FTJAE_4886 [Fusarium tjaetaba]KAF5639548.1 hypothetical protein FTJAE_4886 [Fusarium tjaetaba]
METAHQSDLPLPPEIVTLICSNLPKPDLLRSRLATQRLHDAATPFAFQAFHLRAYGTVVTDFTCIAASAHLRSYVKEITIDTNIGPGYEEFEWAWIEEDWSFRYRILDTVSHCVVGMWTHAKQVEIDERASLPDFEVRYLDDDPEFVGGCKEDLQELTISNLADYHDPNLDSSKAWQQLLRLPHLHDLKLLVTTEYHRSQTQICFPQERHEFFQKLPSTWLSPSLGDHLGTLSLYYTEYWGWFPRMNLYEIGTLPQLKVLALGHFAVTDKRQTDWIAGIGKRNGSGALEELYLDDCPILFEARQHGPLTNDGYPDPRVVLEDNYATSVTKEYGIRWHNVLKTWRGRMKGLRKFIMGHGDWSSQWPSIKALIEHEGLAHLSCDEIRRRVSENVHRNFCKPAGVEVSNTKNPVLAQRYLHGAGLLQRRIRRMQYIKYDIGMCGPWDNPYRTWGRHQPDDGWAPEKETVEIDDAVYELLMTTIRDRITGDEK